MASPDGVWVDHGEISCPPTTAAAQRAAMALVLAMENDIPLLPEEIRWLRAAMVRTVEGSDAPVMALAECIQHIEAEVARLKGGGGA